jgi:hypothetical protein
MSKSKQPNNTNQNQQSKPRQVQSWLPGAKRIIYENIPPHGDDLIPRKPKDNIFCLASNNIAGSKLGKYGLTMALDIKVTEEIGADMMALQETRKPWNSQNRQAYRSQARMLWPQGAAVEFSSPLWRYDEADYQAGGTALLTHTTTVGRIEGRGSDPAGRFCWMLIRGGRDKGLAIFSMYRTPHTEYDDPGPFTAYTAQYEILRAHGVKKPNPRQQTLDDVAKLIDEMREKGFWPIVAMDANEDWIQNSHPREKERLRKFIECTQLADPYYEKFRESPQTFIRGPWRLDYILIDPSLLDSVKQVGYLGSHEGNFSDHCLAYIDFDSQMLFRGQVNRPVEIGSREFMLEQTDKKLAFTCKLRKLQYDHRINERVFKLARCFAEHGDTEENVKMYNKLDTEHKELVLSAASKAGHRKYGYMRSKNLVEAGQHLILLKALQDCKQRNEPLSAGCLQAAKGLKWILDSTLKPVIPTCENM